MSKLNEVDLVAIGLTGEDLIQIDSDLEMLTSYYNNNVSPLFSPTKGLKTVLDMIEHLKEFGIEKPTEEELNSESETII